MRRWVSFVFALVVLHIAGFAGAAPLDPKAVPEPLKPWTAWALQGKESAGCPSLYGKDGAPPRCAWPARLDLVLDEKGGKFSQSWHTDAPTFVPLPGDAKRWPLDVKVKGGAAAVIERGGAPGVLLDKGDVTITGVFAWDSLPESLRVPPETALLALTVRGAKVAQPHRDAQGTVWLQKTVVAEEGERLEVLVHRQVTDDVPLLLTTRVVLNVAGKNREVLLGKALPPGFVPVSLDAQLPARVEPDGRLRVQVRPGTWTIELVARSDKPTVELRRPAPDGPWREGDEVWVFDARPSLRLVEVEGVSAIDPQQTSLPDAWKRLPAYPMKVDSVMRLVEKRRGDAEPPPDQLTLTRTLWLDFDGRGYTASDRLTGRLSRASRLEMAAPTVLGRVAIRGRDQFITNVREGATGVEVRQGELDVTADSRVPIGSGDIPAVGWDHDFHKVIASLNVPPGWRLLHASGVDDVPSTWVKHWTLLELFLVLVIAVAVARLFGPSWGALALLTLALTFPERDAPKWIWIGVVVVEALCRAAPEKLVRLRRALVALRVVVAGVLLLVSVPFLVEHVREGIFPGLGQGEISSDFGDMEMDNKEGGTGTRAKGEEGSMGRGAPPPPQGALAPAVVDEPAPEKPAEQAQSKQEQKVPADADDRGGKDGLVDLSKRRPAAPASSAANAWGSKLGGSSYRQFNAEVYDPTSMVQTGPGRPRWTWTRIPLTWSGPVARDQRLHLFLLSPAVNLALALLRAALLVGLVVRVLPFRLGKLLSPPGAGPAAKAAVALLALSAVFAPNVARAEVPPKEVLDDLASRLVAKPECAPRCSAVSRMLLEARGPRLRMRLELQAASAEAVPLPGGAQWTPETVTLDGRPAAGLLRTEDEQVWLSVPAGAHQAVLDGPLPDRELVQITLPLKPHHTEARVEGWRLEGLHEDGLVDENLQLTRIREAGAAEATLSPGVLPPFVRVERTILVGLNWQVQTRVVRLSPPGSAVVLEVPLLPGESVTTADVRVAGGKAQINMPSQATELAWSSVLAERSPIELKAPEGAAWTELWRLDVSPIWHVEPKGIPAVHAEASSRIPEWRPWPGESTVLDITRPGGVVGQTVTIDESTYVVQPGLRATDASLRLEMRSSRGAQHVFTLPSGSTLERVTVAGRSIPLRQEGDKVTVPLSPGAQTVELAWRAPSGVTRSFSAPAIDLGAPSVNATTRIVVSDARWVLFAGGPRLGPAVTFWSLLLVLLVVSVGLARLDLTPLSTPQWMLLAIGLSQIPVPAAAIVVVWLIALGSRRKHPIDGAVMFNLRQVALLGGTVIALAVLVAAVHQGLLGHPEMQIRGNGSSSRLLVWFEDRAGNVPSSPWFVSLPLVVYRGLMLAWALWLAVSVVRWLRWGYGSFTDGGAWRSSPPRPPPPMAPPPMAQPHGAPAHGYPGYVVPPPGPSPEPFPPTPSASRLPEVEPTPPPVRPSGAPRSAPPLAPKPPGDPGDDGGDA